MAESSRGLDYQYNTPNTNAMSHPPVPSRPQQHHPDQNILPNPGYMSGPVQHSWQPSRSAQTQMTVTQHSAPVVAATDNQVPLDTGKRICPFAVYNPTKYNLEAWPQCHQAHEKNGDIVVHLGRHHRLIRSQRKDDKNGRKNGNGQSYIAICSEENFDERGESQCRECDSFENLSEEASKNPGPYPKTPHKISAICQKCWLILGSREDLTAHLNITCGGRSPKHLEKWELELRAFCQMPDWISPSSQELPHNTPGINVHPSNSNPAMPVQVVNATLPRGDLTIAPPPHPDTQSSMAYTEDPWFEIDKLRLHLWLITCHDNHPWTSHLRSWYRDNSRALGMSLPGLTETDARLAPPSIGWPFHFSQPTIDTLPPTQPTAHQAYTSVQNIPPQEPPQPWHSMSQAPH